MLTKNNKKIIGWIVFTVYIFVLLKITVFRAGFLEAGLFANGDLNVIPFAGYLKILEKHAYLSFVYLFGGNIAWFIPLGFLLPSLTGRLKTLKPIIISAFLLSFVIELSQYAFGTGKSEIDDLILNTTGAIIGYFLFLLYSRVKKKE